MNLFSFGRRIRRARFLMLFTAFFAVLLPSFSALGQVPMPQPPPGGEVSVQSLLPQMVDLNRLARRPAPYYTTAQASSYDRASGSKTPHDSPQWFANGDAGHFVRIATSPNGLRREYVLADLTGPGAIVRVWSANPSGTLRFYFDNEKTARLSGTMDYLLAGRIAPLTFPFAYMADRGANLYFPLPYKERCVVTVEYEGGITDKADGLYYHVGYRTYAKNTPVRTFTLADLSNPTVLVQMKAVRDGLMHPMSPTGTALAKDAVLKPNQSLQLPVQTSSKTGAAIRELRVQVPLPVGLPKNAPWEDKRQLHNVLRNLILSLSFDGQETVRVPVSDFFGSGVGLNTNEKAFPVTVHPNGIMICRWVMPFSKNALVKIENRNAVSQKVSIVAVERPFVFDTNTYLFHAQWTAEKTPTRPFHDMTFLDATGEGRFVGVSLAVANPSPDWWGEGDEKVYRDGEAFPSIFGTGSEDYFGYAWSSPRLFAAPYHAQTRCDGPGTAGHVSDQRWQIFDDLPFEKSLRFDMEEWHWTPNILPTFARTAYWYASPKLKSGTANGPILDPAILDTALLLPPHITPPAPVAGAIEGETMPLASLSGGNLSVQTGFWELSGGKQRWWRNPKFGDKLVLQFPVAESGTYQVAGSFCFARDYGIHKISVNGQAATPSPADFFAPNLHWEKRVVGTFALTKGTATFQVENAGKNINAAPGQMFGVDYLLLKKVGPLPAAPLPAPAPNTAVPVTPPAPAPQSLVWPNDESRANSDEWLVRHHDQITEMRPRLLVLNFANGLSAVDAHAKALRLMGVVEESSRYHGYANPHAPPFLRYDLVKIVNLTDDGTQKESVAPSPDNNSSFYPRDPTGGEGSGRSNFRYADLFSDEFAKKINLRAPGQLGVLRLDELVNRGVVHEVWFFAYQGKAGAPSETTEIKQVYDAAFRKIPGKFTQAGNALDNSDFPATGRSLRIVFINASRGPGCALESLSHSIEATANANVIPWFTRNFNDYAGFDLNTRYGLPFDRLYGHSPVTYPDQKTLIYQKEGKTVGVSPYVVTGGNVHFCPTARQDYDLTSPFTVLSTIEHYGLRDGDNGKDKAEPWTTEKFARYKAFANDCQGPWLVYWRQNMPGRNTKAVDLDNQPMKNWWPFLFY